MYAIAPHYLGMTNNQQADFRLILKSFYKSALYSVEDFEAFNSEIKKIGSSDHHTALENISKYISKYITSKDENVKKRNKNLEITSKLLAGLAIKEKNIFNELKQGGRHNFVNYVELSIAELNSDNYTVRCLLKEAKYSTLKSVREMQYFRHNAPDQLLR